MSGVRWRSLFFDSKAPSLVISFRKDLTTFLRHKKNSYEESKNKGPSHMFPPYGKVPLFSQISCLTRHQPPEIVR